MLTSVLVEMTEDKVLTCINKSLPAMATPLNEFDVMILQKAVRCDPAPSTQHPTS